MAVGLFAVEKVAGRWLGRARFLTTVPFSTRRSFLSVMSQDRSPLGSAVRMSK